MKMCSALQRRGANTTLYAEGSLNSAPAAREALFQDFDVTTPFNFVRVEHGPAHPTEHSVKKAIAAANDSSTHLITRSPKAAYFAAILGIDTLLELHAPPQGTLRYVRDLSRLREFRGLIVITHALREEVIRYIPEVTNKIWIVPDAADEPKSVGRIFPLRYVPHANFHVGYVGHLYSGKGLELIVDIAAQLPDVAFHVLGGDSDDIRRWEKRNSGRSNIVFYGHRPHAEVPMFLKSVDVAIAPFQRKVFARGNTLDIGRWMSPLKIFEYMANAKPIVTSDVAVLREVLKDGQTALLIDPNNIDAWVSAIQMLRADPELRANLGRAAKREFEEKFTWSKRAERILELLIARA
jgi:glycosyltransferase involved in cell wall biosynthesis